MLIKPNAQTKSKKEGTLTMLPNRFYDPTVHTTGGQILKTEDEVAEAL